jgi:hypothetical protein
MKAYSEGLTVVNCSGYQEAYVFGLWFRLPGSGNDEGMAIYRAMEHATSKDPHDWGRAMAVALTRLLEAAQTDRSYLERKHLIGQDIVMRIEAEEGGACVHLSWRPQNQDDAPPDDDEAAERLLDDGASEAVEGSGRGG